MTPKEKANDLISKMCKEIPWYNQKDNLKKSKIQALICIDEIINIYKSKWNIENTYWQEVKQEIEKL